MKLSIEPRMWIEPRFEAFRSAMGWTQPETLGVLVLLWHGTRSARLREATLEELAAYLPLPPEAREGVLLRMVAHGYLTPAEEGRFAVDGNGPAIDLLETRRHAAKRGHEASRKVMAAAAARKSSKAAPKAPTMALAKPADDPEKALAAATWQAYREAFVQRWATEPIRNAKVNGQIRQIVKRLGADAPEVLRFFVAHNDEFYVRQLHSVGNALRDAEPLHAQWRRRDPVTAADVRRAGEANDIAAQLQRIRAR